MDHNNCLSLNYDTCILSIHLKKITLYLYCVVLKHTPIKEPSAGIILITV
jgi:hypothetical protein